MQKFDTPAPVSAVLDIPAGRIRVIAADRADTTVEVVGADASKRRDVKAAEQVKVAYGDGVLRIEGAPASRRILGDSGSVEVTIQLPVGSHVEAKASTAELRGVGRLGDVAFEGAQGSVKLDEAASACLSLEAGDISVGRLGGDAEITTKKGEISVAEAIRGKLVLRTEVGNVSVSTARGVGATLDASTTYGRIHNAIKTSDDAALTIYATTAHGDISARSL